MAKKDGSMGVVKARHYDLGVLELESGEKLEDVRIAYETYGGLNKEGTNAILICHSLSGDAHAAGKHRRNSRKHGWYDVAVGPGKTFDTRKYFIVCSNVVGGCKGSTGPSSTNPETGRPYGLDFPIVTVRDMVRAQRKLLDHLGVKKLFAVAGGSLGGMQALQWSLEYPGYVHSVIAIATAAKQYPMGIAFHEIGRQAIQKDPRWKGGDYYGSSRPADGLALARQVGHITYLSQDTLERKFNRNRKNEKPRKKFGVEFEIQSYLQYKGNSFVRRFDANSYLYITHAIDQFDLTEGGAKSLRDAFKDVKSRFLLVSFTSDWLYPPEQVEEIYEGLAEAGAPTTYRKLDLPYGHDAFLVYNNTLGNVLVGFIEREEREYGS
ncbi:MAG: homoserine O-acetyltransferase [Candidatus Altiarchaeales archaeon]|nr:homoserine O-acetyltransferase [Candidatus Altiarchaeales archaeon]MBD3417340.1 homoserine O-acetyltransferase [Candidatus Altiarchaeales archaeon]